MSPQVKRRKIENCVPAFIHAPMKAAEKFKKLKLINFLKLITVLRAFLRKKKNAEFSIGELKMEENVRLEKKPICMRSR